MYEMREMRMKLNVINFREVGLSSFGDVKKSLSKIENYDNETYKKLLNHDRKTRDPSPLSNHYVSFLQLHYRIEIALLWQRPRPHGCSILRTQ